MAAFALLGVSTAHAIVSTIGVTLSLSGTGSAVTTGAGAAGAVAGTLTLAPFGSATFTGTGTAVLTSGGNYAITSGTFTASFPSGDTLSGTITFPGAGVVLSTSGVNYQGASVTITGGTGLFVGADGSFPNLGGTITQTGSTTFSLTMMGSGLMRVPSYIGTPVGLRFVPVTPCRVADTRNPSGPFGGPMLSGGLSRDFPVLAGSCSVPTAAQVYSLNATVVPQTASLGFLTLWPAGIPLPTVSTLNALDGSITSNAAILPGGNGGAVSAYAAGDTHLVLDITGYFAP